MKLPRVVIVLGYAGLIPFVLGPLWLTVAPASAPAWLDRVWICYVAVIAAFLAGTFWGFALPALQGPAGLFGLLIASTLAILAWLAMSLPFWLGLYVFAVMFLLLLLADFWRERTLDTIPGYFRLRTLLTVGSLITIAWRLMLARFPT